MDWIRRKTKRGLSVPVATAENIEAASPPATVDGNSRPTSEVPDEGQKKIATIDGQEGEMVDGDTTAIGEKTDVVDGSALTQSVSAMSNDDDVVYPKGFRLTVITISLCFAVFLVALDQTIIATAMYALPPSPLPSLANVARE
jgi:hypothetical protein